MKATVYTTIQVVFKLFVALRVLVVSQNATDPPLMCRSERGELYFDEYKLDTCARCYAYLPEGAFLEGCKLSYDPSTGLLWDRRTNASHVADPNNSSHTLISSFTSDEFLRKWASCCHGALLCCRRMNEVPPSPPGDLHCPRTWDGWQCWPDTPAGEMVQAVCEDHVFFMSEPSHCPTFAVKQCWENGSWFISELNIEWTNYSGCGRIEGMRRMLYFHIATYAISILFLLPALFIFSTYKQLQVHRITMHKHLFVALLINAVLIITFKTSVLLDEMDKSGDRRTVLEENGVGCKLLNILTKYSRMCTYMWMLCEGFYLHKLIAAAFAEQKSLVMFYFIGWVFPIFPVGSFALLRWKFEDDRCWAIPVNPYEWVTNGLNLLSLLLNMAFLFNIIRVLVTKLRATHADEPSQFRKAVRATLVLVPLFGLHFFLVILHPQFGECSLVAAYMYFNFAMDGFQGLLVSLIFCYLNGEVIELIRRSMYRFQLRYSLDAQPTSVTNMSDVSMGRSRQSTNGEIDYTSSKHWRTNNKSRCSIEANTELAILSGGRHNNEEHTTVETSLMSGE